MAVPSVRVIAPRETLFSRIRSSLLGATSIVAPSRPSPFQNFGVLAARDVAPRLRHRNEMMFTVREARDRLADFLNGSFKPKSLTQFMDYLSGNMLRLEARRLRDGKSANYLVDQMTRKAVLAAAVDRRLTRPGLARMFGRTLDAEAETLRRKMEQTPEQADARLLRSRNASRLLSAGGSIPFQDWEDIRFSSPAMFEGRELTAQGGEVWLGTTYARASADPAANLAILRKAKAEGRRVIIPARNREEAMSGRFVPGMPIILRDGAVRTKLIDPSMTFQGMTDAFGQDPYQHFGELSQRLGSAEAMSRNAEAKVVNIADFKAKFARKPKPVEQEPARETRPAAAKVQQSSAKRNVIRHELVEGGAEAHFLTDLSTGDRRRVDPRRLPAGRYEKEDAFGLPTGWLVVDAERGYVHYDEHERYHNPYGPAIVAGPNSTEPPRFAMEGEFISAKEFTGRRGGLDAFPASALRRRQEEPEYQAPGMRI